LGNVDLRWFGYVECKDDASWVKCCMMVSLMEQDRWVFEEDLMGYKEL